MVSVEGLFYYLYVMAVSNVNCDYIFEFERHLIHLLLISTYWTSHLAISISQIIVSAIFFDAFIARHHNSV